VVVHVMDDGPPQLEHAPDDDEGTAAGDDITFVKLENPDHYDDGDDDDGGDANGGEASYTAVSSHDRSSAAQAAGINSASGSAASSAIADAAFLSRDLWRGVITRKQLPQALSACADLRRRFLCRLDEDPNLEERYFEIKRIMCRCAPPRVVLTGHPVCIAYALFDNYSQLDAARAGAGW